MVLAVPPILILVGCHSTGASSQPSPPATSSRLLPTGALLDPAAPSFPAGNMPLAIVPAPGPAGRCVLSLSGWREQGVQVVDTVTRRVLQTLPQAGAFVGLAFSSDGNTLFASGGDDDSIWRYAWKEGAATFRDRLALADKEPGQPGRRYPAGLALSPDGTRLYVAENLADSVAVVDTTSRRVIENLPVGRFPYAVAVASDGTVWISAWGGDTVASFVPDGHGGLDEAGRVATGRHPSALLLNADSSRLFVASASTDRIAVVDTHARRVIAILRDPATAETIEGSTPNALALSVDGRRLFVAEADNNAVAVFDLSSATAGRAGAAGDDRLAGRLPCDWYPTALAVTGGSLVVVNGKGAGAGPNPDGPRPSSPLKRDSRSYTLGQLDGTITVLPLDWAAGALARMTRRVAQANGWDRKRRTGHYPPFEHVIYILKENRTYDQVLSDLPSGDGDPSLLFFPRDVSPNHHALAERFGLFDRFFVNAEVSSQGHVWSTAAYVTDYGEKTIPSAYSSRREEEDPGDADQPAAGYLWHSARERGILFRNYGEAMEKVVAANGTTRWQTRLPDLMEVSHPTYPGWDPAISDQVRAGLWIADLREYVSKGSMPGLQFLWLPNDHTAGTRPGLPTPRAYMADNDLALGRIVEALSASPFWKNTVVFVLEDDAQAGPDHVDSHRSILLVISAYNRPDVIHRFVNTTDVLATIEEILDLRSLSQFDHFGRVVSALFSDTPDLTPFSALTPSVPWTELNPPSPGGPAGIAQLDPSEAGEELDLSAVDTVDDDLFNRVLWKAIKGPAPYPAPARLPLLDHQRAR
jgi:YVTN family beta-propeller protein